MKRPSLKKLVGWAVGLILLAWLVSRLPLGSLPAALARIGWGTWLLACGALWLSYGIRAARMQVVLKREAGLWWPRRAAWRLMLLYNGAIVLLPFRAGELAFPWLAAREFGTPGPTAVAAWVWMRVQDVAVLALLALLAWPAFDAPARAGLVGLWLVGVAVLEPASRAVLARLPAGLSGGVTQPGWRGRFIVALGRLRLALEDRAHHHPLAWVYTLLNWTIKMAGGMTLVAAAAGIGWEPAWAGMVGVEIVSILPVQGPAGFGTFEAGVHAGVAWLGGLGAATPAGVILAALVWHLTLLASAVLGAVICGLRGLPRTLGEPATAAGAASATVPRPADASGVPPGPPPR